MSVKSMELLQDRLGYNFNNADLLKSALSHSSFVNESKRKKNQSQSNERLEFLGDSVLSMLISEYIFINHSNMLEGDMTRLRSSVVCEYSLAKCAKLLELGDFMYFGKGELLSGGKTRDSILADALEAIIGAVFIDGGIEAAKSFVISIIGDSLKESLDGTFISDFKTELQELVQKSNEKVQYTIISESGPDHDKSFVSAVSVGNEILGKGKGKTKKEAEQNAAKEAMRRLKEGQNND